MTDRSARQGIEAVVRDVASICLSMCNSNINLKHMYKEAQRPVLRFCFNLRMTEVYFQIPPSVGVNVYLLVWSSFREACQRVTGV